MKYRGYIASLALLLVAGMAVPAEAQAPCGGSKFDTCPLPRVEAPESFAEQVRAVAVSELSAQAVQAGWEASAEVAAPVVAEFARAEAAPEVVAFCGSCWTFGRMFGDYGLAWPS